MLDAVIVAENKNLDHLQLEESCLCVAGIQNHGMKKENRNIRVREWLEKPAKEVGPVRPFRPIQADAVEQFLFLISELVDVQTFTCSHLIRSLHL